MLVTSSPENRLFRGKQTGRSRSGQRFFCPRPLSLHMATESQHWLGPAAGLLEFHATAHVIRFPDSCSCLMLSFPPLFH